MCICAVRQLLGIEGDFRCFLEEDGCEIVDEVMEAIFADSEKIGVIMIVADGEEWTPGITTIFKMSL